MPLLARLLNACLCTLSVFHNFFMLTKIPLNDFKVVSPVFSHIKGTRQETARQQAENPHSRAGHP
jgi:hypothetical protein